MKTKPTDRFCALLLSLLMCVCVIATPAFAANTAKGDCSGDGNVSLLDLLYLKKALAEDSVSSLPNRDGADMDSDGNVNLKDLLLLKNYLANPPVEDEPETEKPTPSEGLEIDEEAGSVAGIGTCTDSFIILPEESNGVGITSIDAAAFAGEEFTSIYIPSSITEIGKKAFNNCDTLTDVYYEGTEEQWNAITIGSGNTALIGATVHYNSYGPEQEEPTTGYTVTFKDYDGTLLSTQTVAAGAAATAPGAPSRDGYTFAKWSGNLQNVTEDRTVTAVYYEGTGSAFIVGDAYTTADGTQIAVPVYVKSVEGFTTAKVTVTFGDQLSLTGITAGDSFSTLVGAQNYPVTGSVIMVWYSGTTNVTGDYTFATLYFDNTGLANGESAAVTLTYDADDVSNTAGNNVTFAVVNGSVTVDGTSSGDDSGSSSEKPSDSASDYTVTFKDYDGTVLSTQTVAAGAAATAPGAPSRDGYTFAKWSGNLQNVTEDRTVTAVYYEGTGSAFIVGDAYTTADGTQIAVPVYVKSVEGFTTAKVTVTFGDQLSLTGITAGDSFSTLVGAQNYPVTGSVIMVWYSGTTNITGDYTFATLYFDPSILTSGSAEITLTFDADDVSNTSGDNVNFAVVNGSVTVA